MRTSTRTECPGSNRRRGEQEFVTAEDVLPLVADIAINPQEYFVCPTMRLQPTQETARLRRVMPQPWMTPLTYYATRNTMRV